MAFSKIIVNGITNIDLTLDTINSATAVNGSTGHGADGQPFVGSLSFVTYYTGSTDPSASTGNNGDIYLKVVS